MPGETPEAALKKFAVVTGFPLEAVELSVRHDLEEKTHGPDRESEEIGEEDARPGEVVDHEDREDNHQKESPLKQVDLKELPKGEERAPPLAVLTVAGLLLLSLASEKEVEGQPCSPEGDQKGDQNLPRFPSPMEEEREKSDEGDDRPPCDIHDRIPTQDEGEEEERDHKKKDPQSGESYQLNHKRHLPWGWEEVRPPFIKANPCSCSRLRYVVFPLRRRPKGCIREAGWPSLWREACSS